MERTRAVDKRVRGEKRGQDYHKIMKEIVMKCSFAILSTQMYKSVFLLAVNMKSSKINFIDMTMNQVQVELLSQSKLKFAPKVL